MSSEHQRGSIIAHLPSITQPGHGIAANLSDVHQQDIRHWRIVGRRPGLKASRRQDALYQLCGVRLHISDDDHPYAGRFLNRGRFLHAHIILDLRLQPDRIAESIPWTLEANTPGKPCQ